MQLPTIRPDTAGRGLATGFDHSIRYVSRMTSNEGGINGNSWVVPSLPYLWFSTITVDGKPQEVTMVQGLGTTWLWESGSYEGQKGTRRILTILGNGDYRVAGPQGDVWVYYGPDAVSALRGRLKTQTGADGLVTQTAYDLDQRLESLTRIDPDTGDAAVLAYTWATSGVHQGLILAVEKRLVRAGVELALKRWLYTYYDGSTTGGSLNDLRSAEEQVWDEHAGGWARVSRSCYRYYKSASAVGFKHGLCYVLDADGWERMEALGLDPLNLAAVDDGLLSQYATAFYEYDADRRLSASVLRAGTETFAFDRLSSIDASGRNWFRRTVLTRPDGATVATYVDRANKPVLKVLEKDGHVWPEYWEYNEQFRETLHATPASIASFTEPANASQNFSVTLRTDAGLIQTKDYYPESGGGAGSAPGYLKEDAVKEGSGGTPIKQRERTYVARTVGGDTIYKTANAIVYRDSAGGGSNPASTANAYTWRGSTFAVLQHTVTPPVVGTGENGTGATTTRVTIFDDYGNAQWRKNERGRIDYAVHDRLTGALCFRIEDADTATLSGVPSGWITASGFGSNRRTDCESDLLGRATLVLGPAHLVPTKNDEGTVLPVLTRRAEFACYRDGAREVRSAKGGSTSGGLYTLGTAKLRRLNYANEELEAIEATRACECGPLSPAEAFPQSSWKRWRREHYNAAAYRDESRVWYAIPATGEGFENTNYYATRYGRDALGRENRVAAPGGTISRSVIDPRALTLSVWIGTNDVGASDDDPTGGGATGNDMVLVTENIYDGASDGGNGNLTKRVRPVDDDTGNDRYEEFDYDFRDRLVGETYVDGTNLYLSRLTRDNLGHVITTDAYHTSVASGNLTARSTADFDARGRNYKNETFSVDPETGAVGNALVAERWRDASGNVIKETSQGIEGFVKRVFDAFEREIKSYTACNASGGSDDNNPAADTVAEQNETLYDAAGNTVQFTAWQRFHDATGTGPLHGPGGAQPRAIRRYACWWHDAVGRETAAADYGTDGGAVLIRPAVPPATSETVLVTRTVHASTGEPGAVIAPDGTVTRWKRDAVGREIETIENFNEGAAPASDVNRTTRFGYHPSGGLETLTLVNEVTGDQTTRWIYGTTLADSGIASGILLRAKIYPGGDRSDYAYNRQGETVRIEDGNGTVHEYLRDRIGRVRHDCVVTLGAGIDEAVRRISTDYDPKRPTLVAAVTSYDNATPGEGSVLNQVVKAYNGFMQQIEDAQAHEGAVDGSTPKVSYGHADASSGNTARRESITYPNGRQVNLGYGSGDSIDDLFSLVQSIAIDGETGNKVEYTRVGLGRFVEIAYPEPGVRMSMIRPGGGNEGDAGDPYDGFDRYSRTQAMRWEKVADSSVLDGWNWGFNEASNRTWKKNLVAATGQDEAYGYDGLYQVVRDAVGTLNTNRTAIGGIPGEEEGFTYDPTGNWLAYRKEADGSPVLDQTRSNNDDNQLVQIDGSSQGIEYDRAGNAITIRPGVDGDWAKHFELVWDAWNRLVEVKDENGATVLKNAYDGLTRRITKESGGEVVHAYWSDRWKPLEERLDSETTAVRQFLWGERRGHRDELVLRDRDTDGNGTLDERLYATMDYFNGTAILDDEGLVLERYAYSAFGVRRVMEADFSPRTVSDFDWDFGFQGQFIDGETGWYNYGFRFYLPQLGRWINRDPIGEEGGRNLYEFTRGDAINRNERYGLQSTETELPTGGGVGDMEESLFPDPPLDGEWTCNCTYRIGCDCCTSGGLQSFDYTGSGSSTHPTKRSAARSAAVDQAKADANGQCSSNEDCAPGGDFGESCTCSPSANNPMHPMNL